MGSFSIVEVVLLAIVTFIFAIDQFSDPWFPGNRTGCRWYLRTDDGR